jgi:hypothetical protein
MSKLMRLYFSQYESSGGLWSCARGSSRCWSDDVSIRQVLWYELWQSPQTPWQCYLFESITVAGRWSRFWCQASQSRSWHVILVHPESLAQFAKVNCSWSGHSPSRGNTVGKFSVCSIRGDVGVAIYYIETEIIDASYYSSAKWCIPQNKMSVLYYSADPLYVYLCSTFPHYCLILGQPVTSLLLWCAQYERPEHQAFPLAVFRDHNVIPALTSSFRSRWAPDPSHRG